MAFIRLVLHGFGTSIVISMGSDFLDSIPVEADEFFGVNWP